MKKTLPINFKSIKPTILDIDQSHKLLNDLLDMAESNEYCELDIADAIVEMIGRLSDRYAGLNDLEAKRAFLWVKKNMDISNQELVDSCMTIIMNTKNPHEAKELLSSYLKCALTDRVRMILKETYVEICHDNKI